MFKQMSKPDTYCCLFLLTNSVFYKQIAEKIKTDSDETMEGQDEKGASIVLNATSEFCRTLGDIPTYGQSGNREEIERDELKVKYRGFFILFL